MRNSSFLNYCLFCLSILFVFSCQEDDALIPTVDTNAGNNGLGNNGPIAPNNNGPNIRFGLAALPLNPIEPNDNISTQDQIDLGRALFWDPILSGPRSVACATCHHPERGYTDGLDLSIGVGGRGFSQNRRVGNFGFVKRNAPTILNTSFNGIDQNGNYNPTLAPMFWDNRERSLENQALGPLHALAEMRGNAYTEEATMETLLSRLRSIPNYVNLFNVSFGFNSISEENLTKALAAFERTIQANNSPFDQYMRGNQNALTNQEIQGLENFMAVGCAECHNGPMLSDYEIHVLGVRENPKLTEVDRGDGNFGFRTPSLRNLSFTGPYMHNGEFNSLQQVLDFYDDNNNNSQNPNVNNDQLDQDLRNLDNLNGGEINSIIAFLRSLDDPDFVRTIPSSVPSRLNPGGDISN